MTYTYWIGATSLIGINKLFVPCRPASRFEELGVPLTSRIME
ncbi:hypothetical protein SXCC_00787 [Gluconacetobacter sp. SXCC-1]|nr:hypothetical protein SXCC_00787 [Gluconacetobacter sp. SXCC-1]